MEFVNFLNRLTSFLVPRCGRNEEMSHGMSLHSDEHGLLWFRGGIKKVDNFPVVYSCSSENFITLQKYDNKHPGRLVKESYTADDLKSEIQHVAWFTRVDIPWPCKAQIIQRRSQWAVNASQAIVSWFKQPPRSLSRQQCTPEHPWGFISKFTVA